MSITIHMSFCFSTGRRTSRIFALLVAALDLGRMVMIFSRLQLSQDNVLLSKKSCAFPLPVEALKANWWMAICRTSTPGALSLAAQLNTCCSHELLYDIIEHLGL